MNVVRTTTLSIGASLIGSSLFIVLEKPSAQSAIVLVMGVIFLLHGAGFLQEYMVRRTLRWYRTKKPVIGIINDLPWSDKPWSEKGTYAWAWSKMNPNEWYSKIDNAIKESKIKAKPKFIKITKPQTQWFLDRYSAIINPYGSIYPEVDIKGLTVWKSIIYYVLHGGIFLNVADIPLYYAYDPVTQVRRTLLKQSYQLVPFQESEKFLNQLFQRRLKFVMIPYASFGETPFAQEIGIGIAKTEDENYTPLYWSLKSKNTNLSSSNEIKSVAVNRAILVNDHVKSIVEELEWQGNLVTPVCSIYFGGGKFLVSLIFLEGKEKKRGESDIQQEDVKHDFRAFHSRSPV
jgi:hypothetical protein